MSKTAKIYLSEERGVTQLDWFRSYNTFNFGNYNNPAKTPAGSLFVCNDDTLAGGHSFSMTVDDPAVLVLLPVVGAVEFCKNSDAPILINSGETFVVVLQPGEGFTVSNPCQQELINFLQFWFTPGDNTVASARGAAGVFNITEQRNRPVPLPVHVKAAIAQLDGRAEISYQPENKQGNVFVFVIQGAFETEGILLHPRDGALFCGYAQLETEALSNDAIIIFMEV